MNHIIKKLIPERIKRIVKPFPPQVHYQKAYAQDGEDLILLSLFNGAGFSGSGFYVDVGAHHPQRLSNTYFFYLLGWRGINVDAMPGSMKLFNEQRPRDINIEAAISKESKVLTYFMFEHPALNGFSAEVASERNDSGMAKVINEIPIHTTTLRQILDANLPQNQRIDFLTVDVEGFDIEVLESNDWNKYRPRIVLVEDGEVQALSSSFRSTIVSFMGQMGYVPYFKTPLTLFFIEEGMIQDGPLGLRMIMED